MPQTLDQVLRGLCAGIGLLWDPNDVDLDQGRVRDGVWAPYWYGTMHNSSTAYLVRWFRAAINFNRRAFS